MKGAFDQAITLRTDLIAEADPERVPHRPEGLDRTLVRPCMAYSAAVEQLQATLASRC